MKKYTKKQLHEAVSYWRGILRGGRTAWQKSGYSRRQITEAVNLWESVLNERGLREKEIDKFAAWIQSNKIDVAELLKIDVVDDNAAKKDPNVKKAYDIYKKADSELGFTVKSIPAFHRALKKMFADNKAAAEDPKKAAEFVKENPEKAEKAIEAAKGETAAGEGAKDGAKEGAAEPGKTDPKVEQKIDQALDAKMDNTKPETLGVTENPEAAEEKAQATPIGNMNLMNRLHRLHMATVKNVQKKLAASLPWGTSDSVIVTNTCDDEDTGIFSIPDDGNMIIKVTVKVGDVDRKGFKKFIGGVLGTAVNEDEIEQLTENWFTDTLDKVGSNIVGAIKQVYKDSKEGAKKLAPKIAAGAKKAGEWTKKKAEAVADWTKTKADEAAKGYQENIKKVNDEMKKRVGVAAIQEYIMRFCGKNLARKVNFRNIQTTITNEGTESAAYVFTGCVKITK